MIVIPILFGVPETVWIKPSKVIRKIHFKKRPGMTFNVEYLYSKTIMKKEKMR